MAARPRVPAQEQARFLGAARLPRRRRPLARDPLLVDGEPEAGRRRRGGHPIVTLTTDFGTGSPYVAAMKGVILRRCPDAVLVDITHSIPAFNLRAASFVLWAATTEFPAGSVHLAVVDPGVGTERRRLAIEIDGAYFVGPDNGIFSQVLAGRAAHAVALPRPDGASATFEGRDVFAPAAALLAAGQRLEDLGDKLDDLHRLPDRGPSVLWIDGFGNLVTSLRPPVAGVRLGTASITRSARTFGEAPSGALFHYVGSLGLVEVGLREGRADALLGAAPGTPVVAL